MSLISWAKVWAGTTSVGAEGKPSKITPKILRRPSIVNFLHFYIWHPKEFAFIQWPSQVKIPSSAAEVEPGTIAMFSDCPTSVAFRQNLQLIKKTVHHQNNTKASSKRSWYVLTLLVKPKNESNQSFLIDGHSPFYTERRSLSPKFSQIPFLFSKC